MDAARPWREGPGGPEPSPSDPGAPGREGDGAAAAAQPCWMDPPRLGLLVTGPAGPAHKDTGTAAGRVRSRRDRRARVPALQDSSGLPRAPLAGPGWQEL